MGQQTTPKIERLIREDLRTHTDPDLDDKVLTLQSELDLELGRRGDAELWLRMIGEKMGVAHEPAKTYHERILERADTLMYIKTEAKQLLNDIATGRRGVKQEGRREADWE